MYLRRLHTPIGELRLVASDTSLVAVLWPSERDGRVRFDTEPVRADDHAILERAAAQLNEYFAGERRSFDLPLDLRGTEFQRQAWRALADIPFGETASYKQQAQRIGRPKAMRAIGAANGRNPLSIVLPCHRVVGANGALTGFAGGLETKRFLLEFEAGKLVNDGVLAEKVTHAS